MRTRAAAPRTRSPARPAGGSPPAGTAPPWPAAPARPRRRPRATRPPPCPATPRRLRAARRPLARARPCLRAPAFPTPTGAASVPRLGSHPHLPLRPRHAPGAAPGVPCGERHRYPRACRALPTHRAHRHSSSLPLDQALRLVRWPTRCGAYNACVTGGRAGLGPARGAARARAHWRPGPPTPAPASCGTCPAAAPPP